jgi:RNA 2',3'-cyclic 3'-phosphodiesterase
MPRAFIALDLPPETAERLEYIASGLPGVAWVPPHQYHLTLRFLGDVGDFAFENILHGLNDVHAESFYFDVKSVGHFPLRGHPEVLWAGVKLCEPLQRLHNRLESALTRAGVTPEGRKFHPHITLGRLKNGAAQRVGSFEVEHALFGVHNIPVENFHLYTSQLTPEGAIHTLEATYPLQGILEGEEDFGESAVI